MRDANVRTLITTTFIFAVLAGLFSSSHAFAVIWQPPSPMVMSAAPKKTTRPPAKKPTLRRKPAPAPQPSFDVPAPAPAASEAPVSLSGESPLTPKPVTVAPVVYVKRTKNIRLDPAGFLFGGANATFEFAITDKIAIGPVVGLAYYSTAAYSILGYTGGVRATFGFTDHVFKTGLYVSPLFAYTGISVSAAGSESSSTFSVYQLATTVGHQWFFANGFNIGLGGGPRFYFGGTSKYAAFSGFNIMLEILLGWSF